MTPGRFGRRALFGGGGTGAPVPSAVRNVARVVPGACIGPTSFCRVCSERCTSRAVTFEAGRPRVDVTRCDGCGECERACPAPGGAITCVPRMEVP